MIKANHYSFDIISDISHYNKEGKLHLNFEDGPAHIRYTPEGKVSLREYYLDGILHKSLSYDDMGNLNAERYFLNSYQHTSGKVANILHREDGPAEIIYKNRKKKIESYYQKGKLFRKDGPAHIVYNEDDEITYQEWYTSPEDRGMTNRDENEGPSIIAFYHSPEGDKISHEIYQNLSNSYQDYHLRYNRYSGPADFIYNLTKGKIEKELYYIEGRCIDGNNFWKIMRNVRKFVNKLKRKRREVIVSQILQSDFKSKVGKDICKLVSIFTI